MTTDIKFLGAWMILLLLCFLNCSDNSNHDQSLQKSFSEAIKNLPYDKDSLIAAVDKLPDTKLKNYFYEKAFTRIDSILISRNSWHRAYGIYALMDTISYNPIVAALPSGFSDDYFIIIYAAGNMKLDYLKVIVNYKAQNGGYSYTSVKEIPASSVGYLGYGNFFGTEGKKMPTGLKPMDIMTVFRIAGRQNPDTSLGFVDLTGK